MRHPLPAGYRITTNFSPAHPGTDYSPARAGDTNCPCYAPEVSTVVASGVGTIEGNYIILQGLETGKFYYFGHFSERKVATGRGIAEGTIIGILGKTGKATGIHTHCEVRDTRNATFAQKHDPEAWFKQHIKEAPVDRQATFEDAQDMSQTVLLRKVPMGRDEYNKYHAGQTLLNLYKNFAGSQEAKDSRFKVWDYDRLAKEKTVDTSFTPVTEQLYKKEK